jgi:hypothetical protein
MNYKKNKVYLGKNNYSDIYLHEKYGSEDRSPDTKEKERKLHGIIGLVLSSITLVLTFVPNLLFILNSSRNISDALKILSIMINGFLGLGSILELFRSIDRESEVLLQLLTKVSIMILIFFLVASTFVSALIDLIYLSYVNICILVLTGILIAICLIGTINGKNKDEN